MSNDKEQVEEPKKDPKPILNIGLSPDLCDFVLRAMNTVQMSGKTNMTAGLLVIGEIESVLKTYKDSLPKEEPKD